MLTSPATPPAAPADTPSRRGPWPARAARAGAAVVAGLGLYAAFPPVGWWWAAPLGIALLLAVVADRPWRAALGWGVVVGVAYQWPLLSWTGTYVGAVWLLALAVVVLAVALPVAFLPTVLRLRGAPLWVTGTWLAGEALIERVPFGGFPWAKLAFGQADGPYARLATLGGAPLVSAGVVLTGAGLYGLARWVATRRSRPDRSEGHDRSTGPGGGAPRRNGSRLPAVATAAGALVAMLLGPVAGLLTPAHPAAAPGDRTITVAAVQGNVPRAGLDFLAQRRAVLDNHVRETLRLAAQVRAGATPQPDLVIWPENSSDVDPTRDPVARAEIQQATDAMGVPIVVGAVLAATEAPDGTVLQGPRNAAVVWDPATPTDPGGPTDLYAKRHLLPFGEYLPLRSLATAVTPLANRIHDFEPGTQARVLAAGPARLGIATCYEVAFDDDVRDMVTGGADLLAVPTNNATFGYTDMTYQQQGMSRLRAVEHDRAVVVAATSGQSAIIAPDGTVVDRTGELFTPGVLVQRVPLRTTTTLADQVGAAPELALVACGVGAVLVGVITTSRRARRRDGGGEG